MIRPFHPLAVPEVRRLMSENKGDRVIAETLHITRHQARNLMREVERANSGGVSGPIEVPVALCRASPTARPVKPGHVLVLAESIKEIGLRQPINVRAIDGGYEIRGGGHRHAAFVMLAREMIPAIVSDDNDLRAELAEIDENLIRNEYSPAERAIAIARRKKIYEALHPKTKHGTPGVSRQVGDTHERVDAERFTKSTAEATGKSERAVQRDAQRGEAVGADTLQRVVGTALDKGEEIDALVKLSPEKREQVIAKAEAGEKVSAKIAVKQERRADREEDLAEKQRALPNRRYGLLLVDIPRHFNVRSDETGLDRSPENHYPTMTFQELCDLPVPQLAADDCIMIYWSTAASLIDDLEILAEWGFVTFRPREAGRLRRDVLGPNGWEIGGPGFPQPYRTMQVWDKVKIGLGYWFRDRHEFILLAARGNVVPPAMGTQDNSLFSEPKGEHSAKPDLAWIDRLWPNIPKLEMFARRPRGEGWDTWGNEAPGLDALEIEAGAKRRLADEYDAAQERGEVVGPNDGQHIAVPDGNGKATVADIGLTRKDIHEARLIRDAEAAQPGVVRQTIDEALVKGDEPSRGHVISNPVQAINDYPEMPDFLKRDAANVVPFAVKA